MSEAPGPRVSIGLPIYNEGRFLAETLESLLGQTHRNIEIVLSDNASTDDSRSIYEPLAEADPRIKVHRFEENQGVTVNSTLVLELAEGDYFMWASGHDLWTPDLVEKCVEALERNPDSVLAYADSRWIDHTGALMEHESGNYDTRGLNSIGRFFTAFWGNMHPVLGIIRLSSIREIPTIHGIPGADLLVLTELALKGDFLFISDAEWSRRETRGGETYQQKVERYKSGDFKLVTSRFDQLFPLVRLPWELIRLVLRARISIAEKFAIVLVLLPSFIARYVEGGR